MSTQGRQENDPLPGEGSIFSSKESPWSHIFNEDDTWSSSKPTAPKRQPRRQTMTEGEKGIIRTLLDELYRAKQQQSPEALAKAAALREAASGEKKFKAKYHRRLSVLDKDPAIRVRLDELQQAIEDCPTKVELFEWAQANVFSILALDKPASAGKYSPSAQEQHLFQSLIPVLMRNFRERFHDPNLALFIFKTVRNHSTQSYVLGCSAVTYNELITTLWDSFRDLQGVQDALSEMLRSSVEATSHTQALTERVCREAMNDKLWLDHTEEGEQVTIATIASISDLLLELIAAKSNKAGEWGRRKRDVMMRKTYDEELDFVGEP